jgi:hypothetical protein
VRLRILAKFRQSKGWFGAEDYSKVSAGAMNVLVAKKATKELLKKPPQL